MAILVAPADKAFSQVGNDKWMPNGFDLDRLVQRYQGPKSKLSAYIAALTMWAANGTDGNMYLSDWSVDDDPVKPTVDLIFSGKKGNAVSSTARESQATSVQSASFAFSDSTGGIRIDLQFNAGSNTASQIARNRTMPTPTTPGAVSYSDVIRARVEITGSYSISGTIMDFFDQVTTTATDSQEIVKGQYYRNTKTLTTVLQPIF
jgi:hypothetical protein